ncbi:MAG: ATP synthase subunit I [Desulfotomaculaceae bacterium]|nr:ATP synthase subunit I [Desulfotomaculaceae bacterium]
MQDLDFDGQLIKALKLSGLLMAFCCFVLLLRPHDPLVWGMVVGIATGMWSAFFMGKRLKSTEGMSINRARMQIAIGTNLRLVLIIAVLFVVVRTGWINPYATVVGIFVIHGIFIFLVALRRGASGGGFSK